VFKFTPSVELSVESTNEWCGKLDAKSNHPGHCESSKSLSDMALILLLLIIYLQKIKTIIMY